MNWLPYALLFLLALSITASAVYAFFWASKNGQLRDFDTQARSIFDDEEPEGVQTDFFPGHRPAPPVAGLGDAGPGSTTPPTGPGSPSQIPDRNRDARLGSRASSSSAIRHQV